MEKYVKISVKELKNLLEKAEILSALECGGVDNWEWYGEAFSEYLNLCSNGKYSYWDEFIEAEYTEDYIIDTYGEVK